MKRTALTALVALAAVSVLAGQARRRDVARGTRQAQADVAALSGYQQPKPDGALSCLCHELQRRVSGFQALSKASGNAAFAKAFATESAKLQSGRSALDAKVESASVLLREARGKSYLEQEKICGRGADSLGELWSEWQPFLAQNGVDSDYYNGVKAKNPDVPNEGDETADHRGRVCRSGQWWEEDRAYWAINGREGICQQKHFQVEQVLKGEKGSVGDRCYQYKAK